MFVGSGRVVIRLNGVRSLKEKRNLVRPIVEDLRKRFLVSAAEVEEPENLEAAVIGFAAVGNGRSRMENFLHDVVRYLEEVRHLEILEFQLEVW